jgi:protein-S-isoprenylcysteine O-methyltransferase Ste14
MPLTLTNIILNLAYYALTIVLLPWALLWGERALGVSHGAGPALRIAGGVLLGAGAALQAWCIVLFQRQGRGTPSPALPTRQLVTSGPYRLVRNPMNLGEVLVFLGLAAWFGSLALLGYAAMSFLAFHLFVLCHEEPRHARQFPQQYPS